MSGETYISFDKPKLLKIHSKGGVKRRLNSRHFQYYAFPVIFRRTFSFSCFDLELK